MPEPTEREADRLMLARDRLTDAIRAKSDELAAVRADLRLLHQNDPAAYHETRQTGNFCRWCGHRKGTA